MRIIALALLLLFSKNVSAEVPCWFDEAPAPLAAKVFDQSIRNAIVTNLASQGIALKAETFQLNYEENHFGKGPFGDVDFIASFINKSVFETTTGRKVFIANGTKIVSLPSASANRYEPGEASRDGMCYFYPSCDHRTINIWDVESDKLVVAIQLGSLAFTRHW